MTRWFRMYDAMLDDPKVQRLPGELFKAWVNLLCLASRNGGRLPDLPDVSFALRISEAEADSLVRKLSVACLMDATEDGWTPHNWEKRQYKSDSSTERVKEHRRNVPPTVSETLLETFPLCSESVNNEAVSKRVSTKDIGAAFEKLLAAYPKRKGSNPRKPAFDKFTRLVKGGIAPETIVAGAARYAALDSTKAGTEFVPMLATWLNQERWQEAEPQTVVQFRPPPSGEFVEHDSDAWHTIAGELRERGKLMPPAIHTKDGKRGAYVERTAA